MKNECSDKDEALDTINALFPIGQSNESDAWWLEEIEKFGIENLPEELLVAVANRQAINPTLTQQNNSKGGVRVETLDIIAKEDKFYKKVCTAN